MVADDRQQVHQPFVDPAQRRCMFRHRLGELFDAPSLERRVVCHDCLRAFTSAHQLRGERRPWISACGRQVRARPVVAPAGPVHAELHGHLREGRASGPCRNGETDGLEIEPCDRRAQRVECGAKPVLDDPLPRAHGTDLPLRRRHGRHAFVHLVDRLAAGREILLDRLPLDPVQRVHMVLGQRAPAFVEPRALPGPLAIGTKRNLGHWPSQHRLLRSELPRNVREQGFDVGGHVLGDEQIREIRVPALAVQVHHERARHGQSSRTQHPQLHRHLCELLRLHARRRLHLDQVESVVGPPQDVGPHHGAAGAERRLVDQRSAGVERALRLGELLLAREIRRLDEHAGSHRGPGALPDCGALVHAKERLVVRRRRVGLVFVQPEQLVAAQPEQIPRLRERFHRNLSFFRHRRARRPPC